MCSLVTAVGASTYVTKKLSLYLACAMTQDSLAEHQKCKSHEKRDRLLFPKLNLINRFPSEIKVVPIGPVFSNWVNFNKKPPMINCS